MFATIINDCRDANAFARQTTSLAFYFPNWHINTVGVQNDIEAAFNLVDILHSAKGGPGLILANVAPRHGAAKKWENGTPFCYFYSGKTLVISSLDGHTLSLVKKLKITDTVKLLDVNAVTRELVKLGKLSEAEANRITNTQFRSLEFIIPAARWLSDGLDLPHTSYAVNNIPDPAPCVCFVDNFGNIKTSVLSDELETGQKTVKLRIMRRRGDLRKKNFKLHFTRHLKDADDGKLSLVVGSSGFGERQFLEIVIQGKNAAKKLKIASGTKISFSL